jgi:large subunit ribosomal protein L13e
MPVKPNEEKPKPIVIKPQLRSKAGLEQGTRKGRGFSIPELREAGLTVKEALKLGIPVDKRRRSKHDVNVDILKDYVSKMMTEK